MYIPHIGSLVCLGRVIGPGVCGGGGHLLRTPTARSLEQLNLPTLREISKNELNP